MFLSVRLMVNGDSPGNSPIGRGACTPGLFLVNASSLAEQHDESEVETTNLGRRSTLDHWGLGAPTQALSTGVFAHRSSKQGVLFQ